MYKRSLNKNTKGPKPVYSSFFFLSFFPFYIPSLSLSSIFYLSSSLEEPLWFYPQPSPPDTFLLLISHHFDPLIFDLWSLLFDLWISCHSFISLIPYWKKRKRKKEIHIPVLSGMWTAFSYPTSLLHWFPLVPTPSWHRALCGCFSPCDLHDRIISLQPLHFSCPRFKANALPHGDPICAGSKCIFDPECHSSPLLRAGSKGTSFLHSVDVSDNASAN